jgi:hypothetical protein
MPLLQSRPPIVIHSRRGLSNNEANEILNRYLLEADKKPELHPNAELTPEGPQFNSYGQQGGIILQLLERVEMGLKGNYMAPEPTQDDYGGKIDFSDGGEVAFGTGTAKAATGTSVVSQMREAAEEGWEDPQEFAEEQEQESAEEVVRGDEMRNTVRRVDEELEVLVPMTQVERDDVLREEENEYVRRFGNDYGDLGETLQSVPDTPPKDGRKQLNESSSKKKKKKKKKQQTPKSLSPIENEQSQPLPTPAKRELDVQVTPTPSKKVRWKLTKEQTTEKTKAGYWNNKIAKWANAIPSIEQH